MCGGEKRVRENRVLGGGIASAPSDMADVLAVSCFTSGTIVGVSVMWLGIGARRSTQRYIIIWRPCPAASLLVPLVASK